MQLLQPSRSSRKKRRKLTAWIWGVLLIFAAAAWFAKDPLRDRYRFWKQKRALAQAREFVANRDALSAQLALDVAIRAMPGNADTIRVAADILEQAGAPQAMRLRRMVTQLLPGSSEDAARLVLCSLRFQDYNSAKDALVETSPEVSRELPMMQAALAYALATDDRAVADVFLGELRQRFPENADLRHAQAKLHLRHPDEAKRAVARTELEELARGRPELALPINRELAGVALQAKDYPEARRRFELILADPAATLDDRLQKANLALLIDQTPFPAIYDELSPAALRSPADAVQFTRWLLVQDRGAEARGWIEGLPAEFRTDKGVRAIEADTTVQLGDWERIGPMVEAGAWGEIPVKSVRLAISARLMEEADKESLRLELWEAAVRAAGNSLSALGVLQRLATAWRLEKESEHTLWTIARAYPDQTWAHQSLFNSYKDKKNTAGMRSVLSALRQSNGAVPRYQHDWALLTLLREPGLVWTPAKETMKTLYERDRTNATYVTGYALALAQSDLGTEALGLLSTLRPEEREYPPRLPYLAYVNGVARKREEVARLQALADKIGAEYLPEERNLFLLAAEAALRPASPATSRPRREVAKPAETPVAAP